MGLTLDWIVSSNSIDQPNGLLENDISRLPEVQGYV
jgi:hypothetical protein